MDTKRFQLNFFIALLLIVLGLTLALFLPFIAPLALAFMAAVIVRPVHKWFLQAFKQRKTLAATLTVVFVLVVILVPLCFLIQQITVESLNFFSGVQAGKISLDALSAHIPYIDFDMAAWVKSFAGSIVGNASNIFSFTSAAVLGTIIAVIGLFYMLRDGHMFRRAVVELSPLADTYDNDIIEKIERAVNSVVRGTLFTSLLKGVLAALGFYIFGIPHAIFWGSMTAFVSVLPGIGPFITYIPAVIYLFATGATGPAIGLIVWSMVTVGVVDNIIMPHVMGKGFTVHPLFILLSIVGGIIFFGPIGLFLGPLVVALLSALLEIYRLAIIPDEDKKNTVI